MKKIFFLTAALILGLLMAQLSYANTELIWDNSPSWVASTNVESRAVRAGDLNSDGYPDLVQADWFGQIYIYYNNAGQLPSAPSWTSSDSTGRFLDVQLGDINGDGLLDIIATTIFNGRVYVFFNHSGQFNLQAEWVSDNICVYNANTTRAADIDGDGDSDILVQCDWGGLKLLKNDNGILTKNPTWSSSETYVWWLQFDVSDYDGDGIMEVAVPNGYANGNRNEYRTFVYKYNHATGGLDVIWKSPVAGGDGGIYVVTHAYWVDYENDGDLDLITSDGKVFINTNGILSYTPIVFYDKGYNFAVYGMAVGDYNKDRLIDVILTTYYQGWPGIIYYFENSSNGLRLKQTIIAAPRIFLAGNIDYDIDGDEDLLLTYYGSARIYSNRFVETHNKTPLASAGPDQAASCAGSNGAAVTLNGSGSSDPDGDALTYTWTGVFGTITGVSPTVQIPLGTYTITLKVDDGKGGTAQDTVNITVQDIVPPSTSAAITGTSGNNGWYKSDVNVSLTSTDNCSGVKEMHYILDGAETIISGSAANLTIVADGRHNLSYWAGDNAGNREQIKTSAINIDKTPPVIAITGVFDGSTYQFGMVPVPGYTAADALSGVAASSANDTNNNGICITTYTYTVTASDNAGNEVAKVATYYVTSSSAGVSALIAQMAASGVITQDGVANALGQQANNNSWRGFINLVEAQTGKSIDPAAAQILIQAAKIAAQC